MGYRNEARRAVSKRYNAQSRILGLARAYVIEGDTTKARTAYQDVFGVWKNADPTCLKQARAKYAKLQ
jgi:hypothetical protein